MPITRMESQPPRRSRSGSETRRVSTVRHIVPLRLTLVDANLFKSEFEKAQMSNAKLSGSTEAEMSTGEAVVQLNVSNLWKTMTLADSCIGDRSCG